MCLCHASSVLAFMISCINIYQRPIKLTVLTYVVVMWLDRGELFCVVCATVDSNFVPQDSLVENVYMCISASCCEEILLGQM